MRHSRLYPLYALGLLWTAGVLRFVDLQILAVLLEPIKAEFLLSDTQLALLGGLAFALLYGGLGIPVAWLAERYSRRIIIATAVTLWSGMTILCGQAHSFASLFLARVGVGMGEAGAYAPSTSLLADYFPAAKRGRACAVLASAIPVGVLTGFLVGGIVAQHWGWRMAMTVAGLPGLLVGLLVWLTLADPVRESRRHSLPTRGFVSECRLLWQRPGYARVVMAACLFTLGAVGSGVWLPSYFIRHHGMGSASIGLWMAGLYGVGGLVGSLAGGWLAERFDRDGSGSAYARVGQWSLLLALPLLPLVLLNSSPVQALCIHFGVSVLMHMNVGPVLTLLQQLGGQSQRALSQAFSVLVSNIVALPLGPLFVGLCSDHLGPQLGTRVIGLAIMVLLLASWGLAAWQFRSAARQLMGSRPDGKSCEADQGELATGLGEEMAVRITG